MIACRRVRCGSSVYVQKKLSCSSLLEDETCLSSGRVDAAVVRPAEETGGAVDVTVATDDAISCDW